MYYAKQVNPEFAESWLINNRYNKTTGERMVNFENEFYENNVIIDGNKDFVSIYPNELKDLQKNIEYFNSDLQGWYGEKEKISKLANCYFKKSNGKKWSVQELHQWRIVSDLTENYSKANEEKAFLLALKLITKKEWRKITIRGYVQSDWQYGYVSEEITDNDINYIELCYFDKGEEYLIYENAKDLQKENNCGSFYVDGLNEKEELCKLLNCKQKDLVVYKIVSYSKIPQYKRK